VWVVTAVTVYSPDTISATAERNFSSVNNSRNGSVSDKSGPCCVVDTGAAVVGEE